MAAIPQHFPGLPDFPAIALLKARRQWVSWRYEQRNGRLTKPPVNPHTGYGASHSNPATWGSYDEALSRTWHDHLPGIGFVVAEGDGLTGVDLDKCRNKDTGHIEPWAKAIVDLAETYAEVSPSGTGIRIVWAGKIDATVKCDPAGVELYNALRYLTLTGQHIAGTPTEILPAPKTEAALRARVEEFRPSERPKANGAATSDSEDFYRRVNDAALNNLGVWVQTLFPRARFQPGTRAYRVSSRDLGRDLEEDLSLAPTGIVDFGVADMGDARQGRRSPIDIVMEYRGGNHVDAALWLADLLRIEVPFGLKPDPAAAIGQKALAAKAATREVEDTREAGFEVRLRLANMSSLVYDGDPLTPKAIGGTLGWVAEEILAQARRPVPAYASLASIMVGSVLFGRAWRGFTNTSLNLFTIIAGRSGQGKSWPPNAVRMLINELGVGNRIGGRQPTSDSAIERRLQSSPVLIYCLDEIGKMFERLGSSNAGNYERKVMDLLLELWGQGTMPWSGKDAASDESHRGEQTIWYPTLSLIGATTIEPLFKAMSDANVRDGMFARLLLVSVDDRPEEIEDTIGEFSDDLRGAVQEMWNASLEPHKSRGNVGAFVNGATNRPPVEKVKATKEAKEAIRKIEQWATRASEDDDAVNGIVNRAAETVVRLASIRALNRNPRDPVAGIEDAKWAWAIVSRSLGFVARSIERHMFGSQFEAIKKAMLRAIERAGDDGIPKWLLFKAPGVRQAEPRHKEAAIDDLLFTQEVENLTPEKDGAGRPVWRFILRS